MQTVRDPGIDDILSEPMIVRLMASDRVRAEDARALYAEVAGRLRKRDDRREGDAPRACSQRGGIIYG